MNKSTVSLVIILSLCGAANAKVYDLKSGESIAECLTVAKAEYDVSQEPAVIRLAKGEYEMPEKQGLAWPVTICGATGNPEDVIIKPTKTAFYLNHADAVVHSVKFYGGAATGSSEPGIVSVMTSIGNPGAGGLISNVVFEAGTTSGIWGSEIIYLNPASGKTALATHCKIIGCKATGRRWDVQPKRGAMLTINAGGTVRNTLIAGNTCDVGKNSTSKGVTAMVANSGEMINCTVVGNTMTGKGVEDACAGVRTEDAGKTVNVLIVDNTSGSSIASRSAWVGTGANFISCALDVADADLPEGDGSVAIDDAGFMGEGDYRLSGDSPCRNIGTVSADYDYGETDLAGAPRKTKQGAIDIGAYQYDDTVSFLSAEYALPTVMFDRVKVDFSVEFSGALGDTPTFYWDFDGDGTTDFITTESSFDHEFGIGSYLPTVVASNLETEASKDFVFEKGFAVTSHPVHYVDAASTSPQSPYLTPGTAATDIQSAIDVAVPGAEVVIKKGVYEISYSLNVTNDATVVHGATGDPEDVIVRAVANTRCMQVNAGARALVHSLVLENGKGLDGKSDLKYYYAGCVLNIASTTIKTSESVDSDGLGGIVSNCVIRGGTFPGNYCVRSTGAFLCGPHAVITHCVISNNTGSGSTSFGGGYMVTATGLALWNGARGENCLISDNKTVSRNCHMQATVVVGDEGSVLRYSTVVGNRSVAIGGVNVAQGGRFEKCVISGNTCFEPDIQDVAKARHNVWGAFDYPMSERWTSATYDLDQYYANEAISAVQLGVNQTTNACDLALEEVGLGAGTVSGSSAVFFADADHGNYLPRRQSPLVDQVSAGDESAMPTVDLLGGRRLMGNGYDLGAIERQKAGLMLLLK